MKTMLEQSVLPAREIRLNYWLSLPKGYRQRGENDKYPLILSLHGSGARGDNPELVRVHGIPRLIDIGVDIPAIVISPQCADGRIWDTQIYDVKALVDAVVEKYPVDTAKISVTGISMGGYGAWMMGATFPGFFARIAPVCGGGHSWLASRLKDAEIRAYHGSEDKTVPPQRSREMVDAVNLAGGRAALTIYDGVGHNSWLNAYDEQSDLADWLAFKV